MSRCGIKTSLWVVTSFILVLRPALGAEECAGRPAEDPAPPGIERPRALESDFSKSPRIVLTAGDYFSTVAPRILSKQNEAQLKPFDFFKECEQCPEMIVVPSGQFAMGAAKSETASSHDERPQRIVSFAKPFAVGRFSVTFEEWDRCVAEQGCYGYRPSDENWGRGRQPAINLTWRDARAYVRWLARKTGQPYRLLSEAEREYVARAGSTTPFWWGADASTDRANYNGDRVYGAGAKGEVRGRPLPVDAFAPNPWGLYQVHGNVADWVEDCWNPNYEGAPADGSAWTSGDCYLRVTRGGGWSLTPVLMRSAARVPFGSDIKMQYLGVRVARTLRTGD